jgi:hypothetical protein
MFLLIIYIIFGILKLIQSAEGLSENSETNYSTTISNLFVKLSEKVVTQTKNTAISNSNSVEYFRAILIEKLLATDYSENGIRMLRGYQPKDSPKAFFNNITYNDIITQLPDNGVVDDDIWSGSYWPIRYGIGAVRYSKIPKINSQYDYRKEGNTIIKTPKTYNKSIFYYNQPAEYTATSKRYTNFTNYVNIYYSPAEKYDFYVGDYNFTLTNILKKVGHDVIWDSKNDVPPWMGICHGWSVASYMEKRPNKTVTLLAADGKTYVQFFPDDIKALATIYWAEANYKSNLAGYSCKYKSKNELHYDSNSRLILDYRCFGINPATFHIVLANYVGNYKKSLVFDPVVDDNEIWNHPIKGYNISYFNPITNFTGSLIDAIVTIEEAENFISNIFINFTLSNITNTTDYLVGCKMTVNYLLETMPVHDNYTYNDINTNIIYYYVLELDKDLKIVGGEWLKNSHPNYVYGPREWDEMLWLEDQYVAHFNGTTEELRNLTKHSKDKSIKRRSPLKQIIKYIIDQIYNPNYTEPQLKLVTDPDVLDRMYPPLYNYDDTFNVDMTAYQTEDGIQDDNSEVRTELRFDGAIVRYTTRYVNVTRPVSNSIVGIRQPDGSVIRTVRNAYGALVRYRYKPTIVKQAKTTSEVVAWADRTVANLPLTTRPQDSPSSTSSISMYSTNGPQTSSTTPSYTSTQPTTRPETSPSSTLPIQPLNIPDNSQPTHNYPRTPGTYYQPDGSIVRTTVNNGIISWTITHPPIPSSTTPSNTNLTPAITSSNTPSNTNATPAITSSTATSTNSTMRPATLYNPSRSIRTARTNFPRRQRFAPLRAISR